MCIAAASAPKSAMPSSRQSSPCPSTADENPVPLNLDQMIPDSASMHGQPAMNGEATTNKTQHESVESRPQEQDGAEQGNLLNYVAAATYSSASAGAWAMYAYFSDPGAREASSQASVPYPRADFEPDNVNAPSPSQVLVMKQPRVSWWAVPGFKPGYEGDNAKALSQPLFKIENDSHQRGTKVATRMPSVGPWLRRAGSLWGELRRGEGRRNVARRPCAPNAIVDGADRRGANRRGDAAPSHTTSLSPSLPPSRGRDDKVDANTEEIQKIYDKFTARLDSAEKTISTLTALMFGIIVLSIGMALVLKFWFIDNTRYDSIMQYGTITSNINDIQEQLSHTAKLQRFLELSEKLKAQKRIQVDLHTLEAKQQDIQVRLESIETTLKMSPDVAQRAMSFQKVKDAVSHVVDLMSVLRDSLDECQETASTALNSARTAIASISHAIFVKTHDHGCPVGSRECTCWHWVNPDPHEPYCTGDDHDEADGKCWSEGVGDDLFGTLVWRNAMLCCCRDQ